MEFGILGPLEARRDAEELDLGGRNQRAVLALLLLQPNRVVSIERLSGSLYGDEAPVTAVTQVHRQVSELRKVLWPSRKELTTYTIVVIVFVVIMVALVAGLDLGLAKLVLQIFG